MKRERPLGTLIAAARARVAADQARGATTPAHIVSLAAKDLHEVPQGPMHGGREMLGFSIGSVREITQISGAIESRQPFFVDMATAGSAREAEQLLLRISQRIAAYGGRLFRSGGGALIDFPAGSTRVSVSPHLALWEQPGVTGQPSEAHNGLYVPEEPVVKDELLAQARMHAKLLDQEISLDDSRPLWFVPHIAS